MSFLGALSDQISSQFSLGDNTSHTLDSLDPDTGKNVKYGSLGEFAGHFDQSSERRYVEEGYLRLDSFTANPKQFEILMQEPNATVLVKKRMFSSVGDNFRPDFMDDDEKIYYKSLRVLFQNKCNQIAALEKLSKIQKITESMGSVSEQLMPIIFALSDSVGSGFSQAFGGSSNTTQKEATALTNTIDTIRKVYGFNKTSKITSWITDSTNIFQSQFGQGTGVIEITNFTNLSTATSTDSLGNPGNFSLSISDPYEAMLITEYDIEKAISDATNMFYNSRVYQFAKENADKLINDITVRLNQTRLARGASSISIKLAPDTLLGKRVTAILDRIGIELPFDYDSSSAASIFSGGAFGGGATVSPEYLKGGEIAGNDGLDNQNKKFGNIRTDSSQQKTTHTVPATSEVALFSRLISTIYGKLSQEANSQGAFQYHNAKTNYARRKLRFAFSGKLIIQPMDVVNIYINSKSRFDTKLLSGLQNMFTGVGMLQNLNNTLTGFKTTIDGLFKPSGSVPFQVEKTAFVGPNFPNYLWSMIRGQFVSENEGTHVFCGVVENASDQWSDGKYTVNVGGKDNTLYFEQGKINFKPGVDTYNGRIFDPLTPFKSSFDTITSSASSDTPVLLQENQYLLGSTGSAGAERSGLIKSKLGRYAGTLVNEADVVSDRNIDPVTGLVTKIFYAPDGLVYKWKEGIGIFTQFGSNLNMNDPSVVGNPNIANQPFAGQDVMNVLSLLITGIPYNFATYYKTTQEYDGAAADPQNGGNAAKSFAQSLRNDLIKSNTLWGNFIPFKNLVLDEASFTLALSTQASIRRSNGVLDKQIQDLNKLNEAARDQGAINALSPSFKTGNKNTNFNSIQNQVAVLQGQIQNTINSIAAENVAFHQQGGDVDTSFDSTGFSNSNSKTKDIGDAAKRRLVRRQLNFLTRRMSYNVRANDDKNLFIVDDTYDKDYDILAYEKSLTKGLDLYNNEFTNVKEKIGLVASLLNLEVFCDSQGHIRVRSPQYNRMPSSVFYKMMHLKETLGIEVFPKFLNDLFKNKLETLRTRLEVLEDLIRLDCAVLGKNTDTDAMSFILGSAATAGSGSSFAFISDPGNSPDYKDGGIITQIDSLIDAANPDHKANKASNKNIELFTNIESQARSNKDVFSNTQRYSAINKYFNAQNEIASVTSIVPSPSFLSESDSRATMLVNRIFTKSGQKPNTLDFLIQKPGNYTSIEPPLGVSIDIFKVTSDLADKIRDRQQVLKMFYSTIKNAREFRYLDDKNNNGNELITPGIFGNSSIPEVFEHMIEDETYDDYGPGSGTRYIIKRSQIKSISIAENPPAATFIEVQGKFEPLLDDVNGPGFNAISSGNGLVSAVAIDYDMWRNYGFKSTSTISVPFLRDPYTQVGPYACMLLSRNRKNILRGTVTIVGNEFMQPGEVVYIEDRGLLFYVTSVKHSFTYGSSFQTSLELTYGHTPGEYIPTVMDMMGKMIYNNKDVADLAVERQDSSGNDIHIGVLQLAKTSAADGGISDSIGNGDSGKTPPNPFQAANAQVMNNIIYTTAYQMRSNISRGNDVVANLELRTYNDTGKSNPTLLDFAEQIRNSLTGSAHSLKNVVSGKQGIEPPKIDPKYVKNATETTVNLNNAEDRRSPSQKAIDAARNLAVASKGPSLGVPPKENTGAINKSEAVSPVDDNTNNKTAQDAIRTELFERIVDCWISISNKQTEGC